ncbi:Crp/Fnr family transcriptional regulator [Balneatrix alpica]|uniref:Crp/Fnr family transcriptional regulator n=1 Tax=Balneatrix alpica TaxID=75684 RepID=UPI00273FA942|nr:Crp/Fnr family transcriptional regulator [Balneatrix alpica]
MNELDWQQLQHHPLWQSLSLPAWQAAAPLWQPCHYQRDQHLLRAGEPQPRLWLLMEGLVRFYYLTPAGKEFNKSFALPGHLLGSLSTLLASQPAPFHIQALQPCRAYLLQGAGLQQLAASHPDWQALQLRLLQQLALRKEQREADFLLRSASERYQQFLQEHAEVAEQIANYHIASYLGITEVALSRIRQRQRTTSA